MTLSERREKARLRSERWRRAHGIMPRKPAERPWLAEGISRSTWYRRGNRISVRPAALDRADAFAAHWRGISNGVRCFTRSWRESLRHQFEIIDGNVNGGHDSGAHPSARFMLITTQR